MPIGSFRDKGLKRLFDTGTESGIQPKHAERLRLILGLLNAATRAKDMDVPGLELHPLKGDQRGRWAVKVSGNWRVTFEFVGRYAEAIDYEDYH